MAKRKRKSPHKQPGIQQRRRSVFATALLILALSTTGIIAWHGSRASRLAPAAVQGLPPPTSPSKEYIYAGGRLIATEEPPGGGGGGCGSPPGTPSGLEAMAQSESSVLLNWGASSGADHYEVERRPNITAGWTPLNPNPSSPTFTDFGAVANTTYLYRVRAVDATGCPSAYSSIDIATTVIFTDNPVLSQTTAIKAIHVTQLRTAVNAVRAAAGLGAASWVDNPLQQFITTVKAQHITQLRNAHDPARAAIGLGVISYQDPTLTPGVTVVKAPHVQQLRDGVK
jgi:hypothetical protein